MSTVNLSKTVDRNGMVNHLEDSNINNGETPDIITVYEVEHFRKGPFSTMLASLRMLHEHHRF